MQLVTVKFGVDKRAGKSYESFYGGSRPNRNATYRYLWESPLKRADVGGYVVVHTPSHGLTVVEVVAVEDFPQCSRDAYKWVVDVVSWEAYERAERERLETRRVEAARRQALQNERNRLDSRIEAYEFRIQNKMNEVKEKLVARMLEEADPTFKELRDELAQLKAEREALG